MDNKGIVGAASRVSVVCLCHSPFAKCGQIFIYVSPHNSTITAYQTYSLQSQPKHGLLWIGVLPGNYTGMHNGCTVYSVQVYSVQCTLINSWGEMLVDITRESLLSALFVSQYHENATVCIVMCKYLSSSFCRQSVILWWTLTSETTPLQPCYFQDTAHWEITLKRPFLDTRRLVVF